MTSTATDLILKYLISKLDASSQQELTDLLGGTLPSLEDDALKTGSFSFDRLPPSIKNRATSRILNSRANQADEEQKSKTVDEMFPDLKRLHG